MHTGADVVRRRVGRWGRVEELAGHRFRLTIAVDDLAWPMFVLAGLEVGFDIEGPEELAERTATVGAQFTRAAAAAPGR